MFATQSWLDIFRQKAVDVDWVLAAQCQKHPVQKREADVGLVRSQ